jgi:hypothetical protein
MQKVINIHDAQISTATIEIRTLTVSKRQVTLAVFRQLFEEELINHEGSLNGIPWGVINYHPDKCSDDRKHIHVVWQKARELRRATVHLDPFYRNTFWVREMDVADELATRDFLIGRQTDFRFKVEGVDTAIGPERGSPVVSREDLFEEHWSDGQNNRFQVYREQCKAQLISKGLQGSWEDFRAAGLPDYINDWSQADSQHFFPTRSADEVNAYVDRVNKLEARTLEQFWPTLVKAVKAELRRRERWQQQIRNLQDLPHLFIGV